jgi:hypothetical protein
MRGENAMEEHEKEDVKVGSRVDGYIMFIIGKKSRESGPEVILVPFWATSLALVLNLLLFDHWDSLIFVFSQLISIIGLFESHLGLQNMRRKAGDVSQFDKR